MKTFYDSMVIRDNNVVSVYWETRTSPNTYNYPLLEPFNIDLRTTINNISVLTVDEINILQYINEDIAGVVIIDRPFYEWLHQKMRHGWILYDESTR